MKENVSILRRKAVQARLGLGRSTLYEYIKAGHFPKPIRIGKRAVGWIESEVDNYLAEQIERSRADAGR